MKKLLVVLGLLLAATMLFIGCGDTSNTTTAGMQGPQNYDKTGTLQGKIMDAVTNAPIGNDNNSELKIWLIQGTDNRGPSKLINDKNDPLVGEYAFSGIPVDGNDNGDVYFKIVVVKPGYQRFEAEVYLSAYGWQVCQNTYYNENQTVCLDYYNNVINMIGNIYLYPTGYRAVDKDIYVYDPSGLPIPNAVVGVYQNVTSNYSPATLGLSGVYDTLNPADGGLLTDMSTTTDATGKATFSGSKLVLGGSYKVMVAPTTFNGEILYQSSYYTFFRELSANVPTIITMSNQTGSSLFATSASNQVPGTITANGVLTITFNQPIILSTTTFSGVLTSTTGTVGSVTGTLNAAGTTLTITPTFTTTPTGAGAYITYSYAGSAYLKNTQAAVTILGVTNINTGSAISNKVQLISY